MNNMKKNEIVNLMKFISAITVMLFHMKTLNFGRVALDIDIDCFVEWFMIVTGYYTAKRYIDNSENVNIYKESFYVTINRFLPLMPYIIVATTIQYAAFVCKNLIQNEFSIGDIVIIAISKYIPETLLLTSLKGEMPFVEPLWYLSTLLVILPIFIIFVSRNRYIVAIISFIYSGIFFGIIRSLIPQSLHNFLYISAGLCLGAGIYVVATEFEEYFRRISSTLLSVVSVTSVIFCIVSAYKALGMNNENLMCLSIFSLIELPGFSSISHVKSRAMDYLGRLSVPIFVIHFAVGSVIEMLFDNWNPVVKLIVFISVTLVLSVISMELHKRFWKSCCVLKDDKLHF